LRRRSTQCDAAARIVTTAARIVTTATRITTNASRFVTNATRFVTLPVGIATLPVANVANLTVAGRLATRGANYFSVPEGSVTGKTRFFDGFSL